MAWQAGWAFFLEGRFDFCHYRTELSVREKGPERHRTSLLHPTPGSAMLLNVLDRATAERKYTGGLWRSGASPHQRLGLCPTCSTMLLTQPQKDGGTLRHARSSSPERGLGAF